MKEEFEGIKTQWLTVSNCNVEKYKSMLTRYKARSIPAIAHLLHMNVYREALYI